MSYAKVLGATSRQDGYLEGNGYLVSWCVGHLVELAPPNVYDAKYVKWSIADLPILPQKWQYLVSASTKKQFGILQKLMNRPDVDSIVNSCDSGREGELIFRLVYQQAGCKKPFSRLWLSSMEENAIREGFAHLKPSTEYDALYKAALCRERADWMVGINASRLFSCLYGQPLAVGRVMTPVLAMTVVREAAIAAFTPEKFYTVDLELTSGCTASSRRIPEKTVAENLLEACRKEMVATIQRITRKEKSENPPLLYDLTTLQRDANRLLGYSAQQTLDYVQALYEKKLTTYPRTDSCYMQDSRLYGVELDSITGRIAKKLYPQADITVAGFETTDRRDFYDLAVGNVPFGQYKVNDKAYNKLGFSIHNYFFAKAIDQVRPGGVVAFVTSRYTMDSKDSTARKHMAERADLLGAIRLPNNAFRANAGTDVVSDIIFLQKCDRPIDHEPDWVQLGKTEDGFAINQYFVDHPEMVLGELTTESTQYGREELTVAPIEGANLADQLAEAVQHIEGQYTAAEVDTPDIAEEEATRRTLPADPEVKNFAYTVVDGEVFYRENSVMTQVELSDTAKGRVTGMVELRQIVKDLIDQQLNDFPDEDIKETQAKLNAAYDAFTAKYGLLNDRKNGRLFEQDSSYYLLCSLENLDEQGQLKSKAAMFTKRTIRPERTVTSVDTPSEALAVSIGEHGKVDLPYMAELLGTPDEYGRITTELSGVIFKDPAADPTDPEAGWQTADEYLSGNVRDKLRMAQLAAESHPEFKVNVDALTKAQPKDLEASEIDVRLGATWLDPSIVQQFMMETFQPPYRIRYNNAITVRYSPYTSEWRISNKSATGFGDIMATETYGTRRANAYKILEDTLNLRDSRVYDTIVEDGKEKRVLNQNETTLAQQKQQAIKDAFAGWVWKDPQRRALLVKKYNELFNSTRPREYDGSHIHFVGMNPEINLREHQRNAVAHVLYGYNTLLAHEVGAGKSFEMAASAMELKRLGLCQKSLFVVPNHLTEQWASEFLRLYPHAKLLVTSKKDFEPGNRKKFCARIATGDYDAVIIGHSQFEKIPLSAERQERLIQEQMDEIEEAIEEAKAQVGEHFTVKQLEKLRKSLKQKLEKLQGADRKDDVVTFEQLGVDRLFVDESQAFKNRAKRCACGK